MGLEPTTTGSTDQCSANRATFTKSPVRLEGLEPPAHCLEGSCSVHLSYRRVYSLDQLLNLPEDQL